MNIIQKAKKKFKKLLKIFINPKLIKNTKRYLLYPNKSPDETEFWRWEKTKSIWGTNNPERANVIGSHINWLASKLESPSLLDIGCGSMPLKDFLEPHITYFPADIHKRSPDCYVIDINKDKYPSGTYDFICAIGVIEYFKFPEKFFSKISSMCSYFICTYSIKENFPNKLKHWFEKTKGIFIFF